MYKSAIHLASVLPFRLLHEPPAFIPNGILPIGAQLVHHDWSFQLPIFAEHIIAVPFWGPVNSGSVRHTFDMTSKAGDVFIHPCGEMIDYHYHYPGSLDVFFVVLEPWLLQTIALQALEHDPDRVNLVVRTGEPDPFVYALGQAFVGELQSGGLAGPLYLDTLTQTLAVHLLREHSTLASRRAAAHTASPAWLRRIVDFIDAHLHLPLTLADIAAEAQLSPYYLTRVFKQAMGMPLHQYIIVQRVERGRRLLASGSHTIGEIAGLVGFVDHSHFARHFKRRYGVPPSAVVKMRKNIQT